MRTTHPLLPDLTCCKQAAEAVRPAAFPFFVERSFTQMVNGSDEAAKLDAAVSLAEEHGFAVFFQEMLNDTKADTG